MDKNVTDQEKKDWIKQIIMTMIGIIASLTIFAFTFGKETKYSETKELKDKVILLDKEKVSTPEFKERCGEIITYIDGQDKKMRDERLLQFEAMKENVSETKQSVIRMEDKLDKVLGLKYIEQNKAEK